jgi:hypothetical protein
MIESDGKPTIASKRIDPLLRKALEQEGHLADDVARVLLERKQRIELAETLRSDEEAPD